jgi:glucosamine-6-phosphate deaminase
MTTDYKLTPVEEAALSISPFNMKYGPTEKIATLVVDNFPVLGKLTALRFIEWVQGNKGGVISLPTGKTPEHFIKWVERILSTWNDPETVKMLEEFHVDPGIRADMKSLHFVQIDEFYPINPWQHNSFYFYVNQYYIDGFGLDPKKALLMDCSKIGLREGQSIKSVWPDNEVDLTLRYRSGRNDIERMQKDTIERIDQWCQEYETAIRKLGGIGFFLGGIGPDGHIGFNVRGSDHHSTTRLTETNYETQAAAATDLGGIEISRKRLVITIGLETITANNNCAAIIIAAGEAKAEIVKSAIENDKNILYPGSALQGLPYARFYITQGAAKMLSERQYHMVSHEEAITDELVERYFIDLSVAKRIRLLNLSDKDLKENPITAKVLEKRPEDYKTLTGMVHDNLVKRIERGSTSLRNTRFLHTEPHHDDLMLAYLAGIVRHTRDASNTHYFACLTSGFTAVTNEFMKRNLSYVLKFIDTKEFSALFSEEYFEADNENGRNRDVWQYLDGIASGNQHVQDEGVARRMLRNLMIVFSEKDIARIKDRISELMHYFDTQYPGKKDPEHIQELKGMCREWEAECLWGYFGWNTSNVLHLRLGFYTGDIFTEEPTVERDVVPVVRLLEKTKPDIVSVALDPEGSGPDTHYKVLQATTEALSRYEQKAGRSDIKVWGYRNVWYRFHPCEANIYFPVSLNMFAVMQNAFMNTFISQKDASFPSYEHDGPFSELAQKIQVDQYQKLKICLGREWFYDHPSALIRATRGLVFLKELDLTEFYQSSRKLKHLLEDR